MFNSSLTMSSEMETAYVRPPGMDGAETAVVATVGILAAVFVGALVALVAVCRRHRARTGALHSDKAALTGASESGSAVELGDVALHPEVEAMVAQWSSTDALVPHGLAVLKACHALTERLAKLAAARKGGANDIVQVAQCISPRVDDVVRALYPPVDARLLEARAVGLSLAVRHLAMVVGPSGRDRSQGAEMCWLTAALREIDDNLLILREAALSQEAACRLQQPSPVSL